MARTSRLDQLPYTPPLPPLPAPVEPQEDYHAVGSLAQRAAQGYDIHVPVHVENLLHGILADMDSRRRSPVDPFFSADMAVVRTAALVVKDHPGQDYVIVDVVGFGIPSAVEVYPDVIEVRVATDKELGEAGHGQ